MAVENGADHFQAEVKKETEKLRALCEHWRGVLSTTPCISEDSVGDINVAIGLFLHNNILHYLFFVIKGIFRINLNIACV